jgi:hypothetical protein
MASGSSTEEIVFFIQSGFSFGGRKDFSVSIAEKIGEKSLL